MGTQYTIYIFKCVLCHFSWSSSKVLCSVRFSECLHIHASIVSLLLVLPGASLPGAFKTTYQLLHSVHTRTVYYLAINFKLM